MDFRDSWVGVEAQRVEMRQGSTSEEEVEVEEGEKQRKRKRQHNNSKHNKHRKQDDNIHMMSGNESLKSVSRA